MMTSLIILKVDLYLLIIQRCPQTSPWLFLQVNSHLVKIRIEEKRSLEVTR